MVAVMAGGTVPTQAEFHEAIAARSDRWYSTCLKITRSPDLAADAVQDALLNAWNKRHQFAGSSQLATWIHRIAVNAALALIRKQRPGAFEALDSDIEDRSCEPERLLEEHELENELARALAQLTDLERICFVLKHLEQWRVREIAETLDTNEGRVKQALFRAVGKLRVRMRNLQDQHHE